MARGRQSNSESFWSGYDLLWDAPQTPSPARRGALDRARITRTAIKIADREGLEAVSMRRVAQELRAGAMSLYRHVPDKDALVALMIDEVLSRNGNDDTRADALRAQPGWRSRMRVLAESTWEVCRSHPWYPEASMVRPPLTPNALTGLEWALSIFDEYDLPAATKMRFVSAVHFTVLSAALSANIDDRTRAHFNISEQDAHLKMAPVMQRVVESGRYPRVVDFLVNAEHHDEKTQTMAAVELILDGIEARLRKVKRVRGK